VLKCFFIGIIRLLGARLGVEMIFAKGGKMNRLKFVTHDHRKVHSQVYGIKLGPPIVQSIPSLKFIAQDMTTSFYMDWAGRPEPVDEVWIAWKIVNQLKQMTKDTLGYKFKLMPPEIVWKQKAEEPIWFVRQMMQVPDCITGEMYEEARKRVEKNFRGQKVPETSFLVEAPVWCVQQLHVGHYKETEHTLQEIREFALTHGYQVKDEHREIYLTPAMNCHLPDTWRTIVRVEIKE
jgi:hypothetical protein